jgi:hypothetical protein
MEKVMNQLIPLVSQVSQYPFLKTLVPVVEKLREISGKPYTWYLTEMLRQEDILFDLKEKLIDPVRKFMNGPQREIFDRACKFVQTQEPNFDCIDDDGVSELKEILADPDCFKGNRMQQAKILIDTLHDKINKQIEAEVANAHVAINTLKERLCGMSEFDSLSSEQQSQITRTFDEISNSVDHQKLIAVIRDTLRRFEESDYQRLLSQLTSWAQPVPKQSTPNSSITQTNSQNKPAQPNNSIQYIPIRSIKVNLEKAWLANESDVEQYLESMRKALISEIREGKRIQI